MRAVSTLVMGTRRTGRAAVKWSVDTQVYFLGFGWLVGWLVWRGLGDVRGGSWGGLW